MQYRKLKDGDYSFGHNSQDFLTGAQAVSQAIQTNLLLLLGEWWEDTDKGLPLFQNILRRKGTDDDKRAIDLLVKEKITNTPGVLGIKNFSSAYSNKTYTISCSTTTIYGDATVEVIY